MGIKASAFLLFLLLLLVGLWSWLGVAYMARDNYYGPDYSFYKTALCARITQKYASDVFYNYYSLSRQTVLNAEEKDLLEQEKDRFSKSKTNFFFTVSDENNTVVLSNYVDQKYGLQTSSNFTDDSGQSEARYTVRCYVADPITAPDDYSQPYHVAQTLYSLRYTLIVLAAVSTLLDMTLFYYLMTAAGRRYDGGGIVTTWQHHIPLDLFAAALVFAFYIAVKTLFVFNLPGNISYGFLLLLPNSFVILCAAFVTLAFCMNLSVNIKRGKWWHNTVIYHALTLVYKVLRAIYAALGRLIARLPLIWKAALLTGGYLFVNALFTAVIFSRGSFGAAVIWLMLNAAVFLAVCRLLLQMKTLLSAGEKIAAGDYGCQIDTHKMLWDIKRHGENLNNIGVGISAAVEERLKSERLKTELITNVSHDLKTPLTSIVSYIDLLKKEHIESETAASYIAVLDRQAQRLKKLTEDLLEAAKASTGNIAVKLTRTGLTELINQSLGEYAERLEAGGLEIVFKTNREEASISADGRLLWRVFDNLLSNICKYSQPGTRVYITVDASGECANITLLNISKYPLNIPSDELLERFVRGDTARTTEGSGLGLSIARSLTELQGGTFGLTVEGDLFKTTLTFMGAA